MSDEWVETTLGSCYDLVTTRREATTLDQGSTYLGLEHLSSDCPVVTSGGVAADVSGQVTKTVTLCSAAFGHTYGRSLSQAWMESAPRRSSFFGHDVTRLKQDSSN